MEGYSNINLNDLPKSDISVTRGIYFLYRGNELVYIGKSKNIHARIASHLVEKLKEFDAYKILPIGGNIALDPIEQELIRKHKPIYNIAFNDGYDIVKDIKHPDFYKPFNILGIIDPRLKINNEEN